MTTNIRNTYTRHMQQFPGYVAQYAGMAIPFPCGVWFPNNANIAAYKNACSWNLAFHVGRPLTQGHIDAFKANGVFIFTTMDRTSLAYAQQPDTPIIGWIIWEDEPDRAKNDTMNAPILPPSDPAEIVRNYQRMKEIDPSRPIALNLSPGLGDKTWPGRGTFGNQQDAADDYAVYLREACDIVVFGNFQPGAHSGGFGTRAGDITTMADQMDFARSLTDKPIWPQVNAIATIPPVAEPTVAQYNAMLWMAIIHGAAGFITFQHRFIPTFSDSALINDAPKAAAVKAIHDLFVGSAISPNLGAVLNGPESINVWPVNVANTSMRVDSMRFTAGSNSNPATHFGWVFAVNMKNSPATVTIPGQGWLFADNLETGATQNAVGGNFAYTIPAFDTLLLKLRKV